jgi:hypothetical protein
MSETKNSEPLGAKTPPAKRSGSPQSLVSARRFLTIGGVALAGLNVVLALAGAAPGVLTPAIWGVAAACFLASFVVYMKEPALARPVPAPPVVGEITERPPAAPLAKADGPSKGPSDKEATPLVRRGNPLRLARGGLTVLLGSFFALLLMAEARQLRWGVPLGGLFVAIASVGVMDLLGTFDGRSPLWPSRASSSAPRSGSHRRGPGCRRRLGA